MEEREVKNIDKTFGFCTKPTENHLVKMKEYLRKFKVKYLYMR